MLYLDETHRDVYRIPRRAITPRRDICENLLVPVCLSASHVAMTSIRMEPMWMIVGESAGNQPAGRGEPGPPCRPPPPWGDADLSIGMRPLL